VRQLRLELVLNVLKVGHCHTAQVEVCHDVVPAQHASAGTISTIASCTLALSSFSLFSKREDDHGKKFFYFIFI